MMGCPNDPPCGHYWHDIDDYDDLVPTCCEESCQCGKTDEHRRLRRRLYGYTDEEVADMESRVG